MVTLIGAAGNSHTDLGKPRYDASSPDFPPGSEYVRDNITNACLDIPTEGNHVMSISALGPSKRKAYYSNYGVEQTTVSAPGGDARDSSARRSTWPPAIARPVHVSGRRCARCTPDQRGLQAEVAARGGRLSGQAQQQGQLWRLRLPPGDIHGGPARDRRRGLDNQPVWDRHQRGRLVDGPAAVEARLRDTATNTPCPAQNPFIYPDLVGADPNVPFDARCVGGPDFNGFYGDGIVDALNAVTVQ